MLNQVVLVGRIASFTKTFETKEYGKLYSFEIEVERPNKIAGITVYDTLTIVARSGLAETIEENSDMGDIIGIKARLENINKQMYIFAEKISILEDPNDAN